MKACYKKLFIMSALFLSSTYVHNELSSVAQVPRPHTELSRTIAGEQINPHTKEITISNYQIHQKGIFDLWFDSAKLFGQVQNITKIEIKETDEQLVKDYKDLTERFSQLQEKSDTMTEELARSSEEITALKVKLSQVQSSTGDDVDEQIKQEKIKALEELIEQRTAELETAKEAISKFEETKENLKQISEKLATLVEENENLKLENAKLVCELKNNQSKVESEEIKRLQEELAKITAQLEEYKNDDDKDDKKVAASTDDKEDKKDKKDKRDKEDDKDKKASEAEIALLEYVELMKEQIAQQREQQELAMIQQLINPMASSFTTPQVNSYFGSFDAFNNRNQNYVDMLLEFRQQSQYMQNLNTANNWNYGYKDYYGQNAPMMSISQAMPWGNYLTPEQSIATQDYDFSRYGYGWGSQIPAQGFNMGLNTASSSPILNDQTRALNSSTAGDFRLF